MYSVYFLFVSKIGISFKFIQLGDQHSGKFVYVTQESDFLLIVIFFLLKNNYSSHHHQTTHIRRVFYNIACFRCFIFIAIGLHRFLFT